MFKNCSMKMLVSSKFGAKSKNVRINEPSHSATKLTEIISDCLESIFMHLGTADLFSVAMAHKSFSQTAALVFKRKYGQKKYMVEPRGVRVNAEDPLPSYYIVEFGLNQSYNQFAFLRVFGNSASKMFITCDVSNSRHIENYVAEYCCESSSVDIQSYILLPTDSPHATIFMGKTLAKQCYQMMGHRTLAVHHSGFIDQKIFSYLFDKRVSELESLSIKCKDGIFHDKVNKSEYFVFEDLKSFSLESGTPYLYSRGPPPLIFKQLDSLELKGFCRLSPDWIHFITQNKSLTKLKLYCNPFFCHHFAWPTPEVTNEQFLKIAKTMPNLKSLVIDANIIEIQYFLPEFLYEFKSLRELRLFWDHQLDMKIEVKRVLEDNAMEVDYEWDFYTRSRRAAFIRKQ